MVPNLRLGSSEIKISDFAKSFDLATFKNSLFFKKP